ncbi:MAG: MBL fold metallo-hydrolase [Anaerolineae bacterium]|nr:MBL fold metallo-hydrolase [Anaerolineae bacterium]
MPNYMCVTCGVQYAASDAPPDRCAICDDERQYIGPNGQAWTTLDDVRKRHHNVFTTVEPGLTSIVTEPTFAIGQRAFLIQTPEGNILWDCISLLDDATIDAIHKLGGLSAIAICHPHFYSTIVEWGRAFNVPVYLHAADRQWVMRPDPVINFWDGDTCPLNNSVTLIHCGGHFEGSSVLHWSGGADGKGVLLTGDTIYVVADQRYVSFMRSYPNLIPLPASKVRHIVQAVEPFAFDRIYNGFGRVVPSDGKASVIRSAERYIRAISE